MTNFDPNNLPQGWQSAQAVEQELAQALSTSQRGVVPPAMHVRGHGQLYQPYGFMTSGLGTHEAQGAQPPQAAAYTPEGFKVTPTGDGQQQPPHQAGYDERDIEDARREERRKMHRRAGIGALALAVVGLGTAIYLGGLKHKPHQEAATGQQVKLPVATLGVPSSSVSLSLSPSPSESSSASASLSPSESSSASASLSPSESTTDSLAQSPSADPTPSPTEKVIAPTDIPEFSLAGMSIPCETIAEVNVNEVIPMGISQQFNGTLEYEDPVTHNITNTVDPTIYNFGVSTENNSLGYDVGVPVSGTVPLIACVSDAGKLFTRDPSASQGSNAFEANFKSVPLRLQIGNADSLVSSNWDIPRGGANVPKILIDLCRQAALRENQGKKATPAESQACQDKDLDWSNPGNQPSSTIFNQLVQHINGKRGSIVTAALGEINEQIGKEQNPAIMSSIKAYLSNGLQRLAHIWARQQSRELDGNVATPPVLIDQYTGEPQNLFAQYADANPAILNQLYSTIPGYRRDNPKNSPSDFYLYDGPIAISNKSITVTTK